MRQLLSVTLLGCIAFALLCLGAHLVGRIEQKPDYVPGLALCDDVPCYLGIALNKTTWQEAQQMFANMAGFTLRPDNNGVDVANGAVHRVITYSGDEHIFEIDLFFRKDMLPFYSVLTDLGIPCGVYSVGDPSFLVISFRDRLMYVTVDKFRLLPNSSVGEIDLGPYAYPALFTKEQQAMRCRSYGGGTMIPMPWQGFRRYP
jgi:hypothetical protein